MELSMMMEISMLSNRLATSHMWLLNTGNVAMNLETESLILFNFN